MLQFEDHTHESTLNRDAGTFNTGTLLPTSIEHYSNPLRRNNLNICVFSITKDIIDT